MQDTWRKERRRIDGELKYRAWIAWTQGPPDHISARALFKGVITALMKRARGASRPSDLNPRGAIQGVLQRISKASSRRSIHDQTATTFLKRSTMDCFIVTVDHFDRRVTPKYLIKRGVPPICKAFELEINLIDLFRHLPSLISRFHPVLHSFPHPRRV